VRLDNLTLVLYNIFFDLITISYWKLDNLKLAFRDRDLKIAF